jgi:hypothetical protein
MSAIVRHIRYQHRAFDTSTAFWQAEVLSLTRDVNAVFGSVADMQQSDRFNNFSSRLRAETRRDMTHVICLPRDLQTACTMVSVED